MRRHIAPSCLLLAIVLFPLPWIEVRCDRARPAPAAPAAVPPLHQRISNWFRSLFVSTQGEVLVTQTGIQAIAGEDSLSPEVLADAKMTKKIVDDLNPDPAPALGCCLALLVIGVAAGVLLPLARPRVGILMVSSLLAWTILLWQTCIGFPLEQELSSPGDREAVHSTLWRCLAVLATLGGMIAAMVEWVRLRGRTAIRPSSPGWNPENAP